MTGGTQMSYRLYDRIELADGTVGYLIESFEDGAYLFEYATPGADDPYSQRVIMPQDIAGPAPRG